MGRGHAWHLLGSGNLGALGDRNRDRVPTESRRELTDKILDSFAGYSADGESIIPGERLLQAIRDGVAAGVEAALREESGNAESA
jgi:hypothetical protein